MEPIVARHRKIALALHALMGFGFVVFGFLLFVMSGAFVACAGEASEGGASLCPYVLLLFFGVPLLVSILPIVALVNFGKGARGFLWAYAVFITIALIPLGTLIGGHTIYLLRRSAT